MKHFQGEEKWVLHALGIGADRLIDGYCFSQ